MGDGYVVPNVGTAGVAKKMKEQDRALAASRGAASLHSAVIGTGGVTVKDGGSVGVVGTGTVTTYDPISGSKMLFGTGNLQVWDNFNTNPTGYGRIYCDPGAGTNYFRFFPPHTSGTGLENSLTIQGTTPTAPGNVWVYTDGALTLQSTGNAFLYSSAQLNLQSTGRFSLTSGAATFNTGGEFGLYGLPTTSSAANLRLDTIAGVFSVALVSSSARYKQDIEDANIDPAIILKMRGRTWRDKAAVAHDPDTTERNVGFIAEELDDLGLGAFVDYNDDGEPESIQYDRLSVGLLAVAQSQQAQIDALTARLDAAGI